MKKFMFGCAISIFIVFASACVQGAEEKETPKPFPGGSGKFTKLVFADEFEKDGLPDPEKWGYEKGYIRNNEKQYYTVGRLENARVKDGCLVITARKDDFQDGDKTYPITSASVTSRSKAAWKYGRIEVKAKVPRSLGTWPAVWMLPNHREYGGWPRGGEIDILEHVGYDPDKVHFNAHTGKYNHTKGTGKGTSVNLKNPEKEFHIYAVEWFEDRIDWYLDDKKVFTFANENSGVDAWPFDKPFYVIVNLAFGGAWGGAKGVDENALPQEYFIDYVRVFQE